QGSRGDPGRLGPSVPCLHRRSLPLLHLRRSWPRRRRRLARAVLPPRLGHGDRRHPGPWCRHQSPSRHRPQSIALLAPGARIGLRRVGRPQEGLRPGRHPQSRPAGTPVPVGISALAMSTAGGGGSVLVVDVGTSGVRASIVRPDASVTHAHHAPVLPESPAPGLVEFDAVLMAEAVMHVAQATLAEGGPVEAVGIANQRASTIVWDRATGEPVAPGIGWQDLRTVGTCLVLQGEGIRLAPNASATKLMAIRDAVDPDRTRASAGELCFGTVDTWVAWILSGGAVVGNDALHVTAATNAAVTAMVDASSITWDGPLLERLGIPTELLPRIVG